MTAIDELMQHCEQIGLERSPLAFRFYRFHRKNPALLTFLLQELSLLQQNNWPKTSFEMLWHHARWVLTIERAPGERFGVCQNFLGHYSRIAIILCPQFNGFFQMKRQSKADLDFGVRVVASKLEWSDGTPIEEGWRPSVPYVIPARPVPRRAPVQREVA